jgi:hypothetical protein
VTSLLSPVVQRHSNRPSEPITLPDIDINLASVLPVAHNNIPAHASLDCTLSVKGTAEFQLDLTLQF